MFSFSSKKILSKLLSLLNNSFSALKISGRNIYNHSAFTLTELIVVITILSILSVIGFVVMSHQSSVARDGKRISDIQTLSQSAKITSAQLRLLPTPIADSVSLTVSGTFIGYQGFMSLALVNPLGYGSDKIFDPKDNIPYTYRVNQHYDSAQFMAYLENPRFERSIEIAKNQFLRNEEIGMNGGGFDGGLIGRRDDDRNRGNQEVGMNGFGEGFDGRNVGMMNDFGGLFNGKKIQEIASQSLTSTLPSTLPSLFSQAYALDSSTTDLSSRYPYSAGDRLGIFLSKGSNQPLQNGVSGTGSRDISLSDTSTLHIIVGSSGADGYVSTDISTGSLLSLKDGSFDEKALLGMNGGSSGSGSGGGSGNNSSSGYVLTMGEYDAGGSPYAYGYLGPLTAALFGGALTPNPAGDLTPKTIGGKNIDSLIIMEGQQYLILESGINIPSIVISEGSQSTSCVFAQTEGNIDIFACENISIVGPYTVGEMRSLGMEAGGVVPVVPTIPINLVLTPGDTEVTVGWNPVNTATSYTLAWEADNGGYTEITGITGTGYLHTGLTNGATYNYKIKAVNNDGESSYSSVVSTIPDVPPEVPTNFSATGIVANSITLSWDAIADGQVGFTIEYSTDGVNFTDVGGFGGGGTRQYAHNGLTEGTTYYYRIRANKYLGVHSDWSDVVSGVVIGTPLLPTPNNITNAPLNTDIISDVVTASHISSPVSLSVSGAEFRVNGGSWVTSANISNGDQVEYKVQVTQYSTTINMEIYFDGQMSLWEVTSQTPFLDTPDDITDASIVTTYGYIVTASNISTPVPLTVSGAEFRVNGGSWVTSANISNGDQVEYRANVTQDGERKIVAINFNGLVNQWSITAFSCFGFSNGTITGYSNTCSRDAVMPSTIRGQNVVSIGNYAFYAGQITSMVIPDSVVSIGDHAFDYSQLNSVTIGNGVVSIGDYTFARTRLASVVIPDSVVSIGDHAFYNNQMSSVTIGNSVMIIGNYAFYNNQLSSLTIGSSVVSIGSSAFLANQLTSVVIPNSVVNIGSEAFSNNRLSSLTIGSSVVSIEGFAFAGNQLTSVTIPGSVTNISFGAFQSNQLTSVTIPDSVTSIGISAFQDNQLTSVVIGNNVTNIGSQAFMYNQLTSLTIPNSVTSIENYAFQNNQLTSVVIGNNVTNIGARAFYINQITSVVIPNSVTSIGGEAFHWNGLISVTIPNSVTSIGAQAFASQNRSTGYGTVYGPSSGYVKNVYTNNTDSAFDKFRLPNYVNQ